MTETRYRVQRLVEETLNRPADYLAGIQAARQVGYAAEAVARDYVARARGEGRSWRQIAQALGITDQQSDDPAAVAFLWVAPSPSQPYDTISTSWECLACGARVRDVGPYAGHPDDVEDGHAQGCVRHDDEVRAYLQSTGWDE